MSLDTVPTPIHNRSAYLGLHGDFRGLVLREQSDPYSFDSKEDL